MTRGQKEVEKFHECMTRVLKGELTPGKASEEYGFPKTTIQKCKNERRTHLLKSGPDCVLTSEFESDLVKWIELGVGIRKPRTREQCNNRIMEWV